MFRKPGKEKIKATPCRCRHSRCWTTTQLKVKPIIKDRELEMLNVLSFANVDHYFEDTFGAPFCLVMGFVGDEMAASAEIRSRALINIHNRGEIIIYSM